MSKADNFIIVVPARYKSSRLLGKSLKDICGKTMLVRTYDICTSVISRSKFFVVTDDKNIARDKK